MGWREGKRRVRVICVCVCCDLSKTIPARQHRSSSAAALGNCFAMLSLSPSLSLSLLGFPQLLLQWATLFSSPHTRHKSMFDFHNNNSKREIRKAMRKKNNKTRDSEAKQARTRDTGYGRQDAGHYVRAMFKISASCLCYFYSIHFFSAFSCAAFHLMRYTFFVVSLRQMKCIKFRDMRGATQRQIEREGTTHYEYVGNAAGKNEQAMRQL